MRLRTQVFSKLLIIALLILLNIVVKSQPCKDSYNNALEYYNKGKFENINDYLTSCIQVFNDNRDMYITNEKRDLVFKVYKLIINSYNNIDKDNLAKRKMSDLVNYFKGNLNPDQVQERLDNTSLNRIK